MAYQFTQTGAELQDLIDRIYQIAEEYDPGTSYVIGDYCSSGGKVYRCTAATTGTFEPSKWTDSVIVMDAVKSLKGRMDTAEGEITSLQTNTVKKGDIIVHTGTATTSAAGTASFSTSYSVANYACLSVMAVGAVQGYLLLPYKYGDAADGRWGFKAAVSGTLAAIANTSISYVAIFYKYA